MCPASWVTTDWMSTPVPASEQLRCFPCVPSHA